MTEAKMKMVEDEMDHFSKDIANELSGLRTFDLDQAAIIIKTRMKLAFRSVCEGLTSDFEKERDRLIEKKWLASKRGRQDAETELAIVKLNKKRKQVSELESSFYRADRFVLLKDWVRRNYGEEAVLRFSHEHDDRIEQKHLK